MIDSAGLRSEGLVAWKPASIWSCINWHEPTGQWILQRDWMWYNICQLCMPAPSDIAVPSTSEYIIIRNYSKRNSMAQPISFSIPKTNTNLVVFVDTYFRASWNTALSPTAGNHCSMRGHATPGSKNTSRRMHTSNILRTSFISHLKPQMCKFAIWSKELLMCW